MKIEIGKQYKVKKGKNAFSVKVLREEKGIFGKKYLCIYNCGLYNEEGQYLRTEQHCNYFKEKNFLFEHIDKSNKQ